MCVLSIDHLSHELHSLRSNNYRHQDNYCWRMRVLLIEMRFLSGTPDTGLGLHTLKHLHSWHCVGLMCSALYIDVGVDVCLFTRCDQAGIKL